MPGINLYTGNRLEALAGELAGLLENNPVNPFGAERNSFLPLDREIIVVQSRGMERWLTLQLAERMGVWANCIYPFPNRIIADVFRTFIPEKTDSSFFEKDVLTWRLMKLLPRTAVKDEFRQIGSYLGDRKDLLKQYQLAVKLADTFDQYTIYRPEMLLDWEKNRAEDWQAGLWRLLTTECASHRARLLEMFFEKTGETLFPYSGTLPARINVFGISYLPRFHLEVLNRLSGQCEINYFLLNPSREYWGEIKNRIQKYRTLDRKKGSLTDEENLHLESSNNLLASLGRPGRDLLWTLYDLNPGVREMSSDDAFIDPGEDTILHAIQQDILRMINRGGQEGESLRKKIQSAEIEADRSIRVHSCHGPLREIEVLYDILLDFFNNDSDLEPRDVLVMMPSIDEYAPFIEAVFSTPESSGPAIPFSIADRTLVSESRLLETFFSILNITASRFTVSGITSILECPDIARKFGMDEADTGVLRNLFRKVNIRWGLDGSHRKKLGLPDIHENTWQWGLDRLLLGYSMPGEGEFLFNDIMPYDNIEGHEGRLLGQFAQFFEKLKMYAENLDDEQKLEDWSELLLHLLDDMFLPDETSTPDVQKLREIIEGLTTLGAESGFDGKVDLPVIKHWLESKTGDVRSSRNFLSGKVTFCEMLPMRSIPFKVICLLGMNDNEFPRRQPVPGFNLIAREPKRGDRNRRDEDRYIFLETLLSAREKLHISYRGQSVRDNAEIPPSVLVSELLDYLDVAFETGIAPLSEHVLIRHHLQAFSPHYFGEEDILFSYSSSNCDGARCLLSPANKERPFMTGKIFPPVYENVINLEDMLAFFGNTSRYFLREVMGISLRGGEEALEESETFEIKGLDKYFLGQDLSEYLIHERETGKLAEKYRSMGVLPHGGPGRYFFDSLLPDARQFSERVRRYMTGSRLDGRTVSVRLGDHSIQGELVNLYEHNHLQYRYAKTKAKDRLYAWIYHCFLNAAGMEDVPGNSVLVCDALVFEMAPYRSAVEELEKLTGLFLRGECELLPFFPETSLAYAECIEGGKGQEESFRAARIKWEGTGNIDFEKRERDDPYFDQCYGRTGPFGEGFEELALKIYQPLLRNQKKVKQ